MPGTLSMSKFLAFCCLFMGIVLFCVVFGGYTSFYRSQNRIKASQAYLTDACQQRLDFVPGLVDMARKTLAQEDVQDIHKAAKTAALVLQQVSAHALPVEKDLITKFETSQKELTDRLKLQHFLDLKNQFIASQNQLFAAKKRYNDEVSYFETRKTTFPPSLFAKLFGFNKINYTDFSKTLFLPAHQIFASTTS